MKEIKGREDMRTKKIGNCETVSTDSDEMFFTIFAQCNVEFEKSVKYIIYNRRKLRIRAGYEVVRRRNTNNLKCFKNSVNYFCLI